MTIEQVKAARLFLHMDQRQLAELSGVSLPTIQRIENPQFGPTRSSVKIVTAVKEALERAGIEFLPMTDDAGEGVRLKARGEGPRLASRQ
ncbi:helix-turn-helix domain-containing protein [Limimaricola hongkongensis]|nr:helix-turn-helix transcriptional regulator [Limimaricola hongkongensis]